MSASKQKGTGEETRIVRKWNDYYGHTVARRNPASALFDITVQVERSTHAPIEVLATRSDRGQCLYTLREDDFLMLFGEGRHAECMPVHIESKRYARFAHHLIFEKKFGRK